MQPMLVVATIVATNAFLPAISLIAIPVTTNLFVILLFSPMVDIVLKIFSSGKSKKCGIPGSRIPDFFRQKRKF